MNFNEYLTDLTETAQTLEANIAKNQTLFQHEIQQILEESHEWLKKKIDELTQAYEQMKCEVQQIQQQFKTEEDKLYAVSYDKELWKNERIENLDKEEENKRYEIMLLHKGRYLLQWKYAREVWLQTNCPVFFDIGEGYLFQFDHQRTLKKLNKKGGITKCCHVTTISSF